MSACLYHHRNPISIDFAIQKFVKYACINPAVYVIMYAVTLTIVFLEIDLLEATDTAFALSKSNIN